MSVGSGGVSRQVRPPWAAASAARGYMRRVAQSSAMVACGGSGSAPVCVNMLRPGRP
jgi:hypothetical protein